MTKANGQAWVSATRVGERQYVGRNARGVEVRMGPLEVPDAFTPGELLGIALAGCAGMSADASISRRLGPDVGVRVDIDRTKHESEDRYTELAERIVVDLGGLSAGDRERLAVVVERAIAAACTVGNTVQAGANVTSTLTTVQ